MTPVLLIILITVPWIMLAAIWYLRGNPFSRPFANYTKQKPVDPRVAAIVDELNHVLDKAPVDRSEFLFGRGPYSTITPVDPLSEASIYLIYGGADAAASVLRAALSDPARLNELSWLPNGQEYASTLLQRLDKIASSDADESPSLKQPYLKENK